MATRRSIAEQVLRIVNGGNISDDSRIEIEDVMQLVDQERDTLIKGEILDSMYTKGVANSKGELEVIGQFLSQKKTSVLTDQDRNGIKYAMVSDLVSLPRDMGVQRVSSIVPDKLGTKQRRVVSIKFKKSLLSNSTKDSNIAIFTSGPFKMDDNYIVSFKFKVEGTTYGEPKTHNISFNINTKKFQKNVSHLGIYRSIAESDDFIKFLKDFKLELDTSVDSGYGWGDLTVRGLYNHEISDFQINSGGSGGDHGFSWLTDAVLDSDIYSQETLLGSHSDFLFSLNINDIVYSVSFTNEDWGHVTSYTGDGQISAYDAAFALAKAFVLKNADKIAKEQNLLISTEFTGSGAYYGIDGNGNFSGAPIWIQEIEPKGGFKVKLDADAPITAQFVDGQYVSALGPSTDDPNVLVPTTWAPFNVNGIYEGRFRKPTVYTRMPSSGSYNTLYDKAVMMSGRDYYYIEGNRIYLYGKYNENDIESLDITYVAASASFDDTDPYPIASDHESMIVKNLIQIFGVMRQAREDMTNDNLK